MDVSTRKGNRRVDGKTEREDAARELDEEPEARLRDRTGGEGGAEQAAPDEEEAPPATAAAAADDQAAAGALYGGEDAVDDRDRGAAPEDGDAAEGARVWDPTTGSWIAPEHIEEAAPLVERPLAPERRGRGVWTAAIAGGLIGALVAAVVTFALVRAGGGAAPALERRLVPASGEAGEITGVVDIADKARPWVVNISVSAREPGVFGGRTVQGTGSGVIVRSDGYVVTNAHVVQGAEQVEVTLASGESVPGRVVGSDPDTDVAVVKVDKNLPPAVVGSAKDLKVGELAIAIGSPLGLRQTVTAGIVSALGRTVDREDGPPLVDMIQTDAAITQGNSGGALIDGRGALVGINTAIAASPQVGAEGIAFAIPIDIAKAVADELIASGRATHPWLGISGGNIDDETARRFGVSEGAYVGEVVPDSPAARAGLRPGDVIVSFDGEKIETMDELVVAIRQHKVDERVPLEIVRGGEREKLEVTLGDRPRNLSR